VLDEPRAAGDRRAGWNRRPVAMADARCDHRIGRKHDPFNGLCAAIPCQS